MDLLLVINNFMYLYLCTCVHINYYCVGNSDYNAGPYNFTIASGLTNITFNISIINDTILEENEIFHLTIDPSSLPEDVSVGYPVLATVTIVDDDCK